MNGEFDSGEVLERVNRNEDDTNHHCESEQIDSDDELDITNPPSKKRKVLTYQRLVNCLDASLDSTKYNTLPEPEPVMLTAVIAKKTKKNNLKNQLHGQINAHPSLGDNICQTF